MAKQSKQSIGERAKAIAKNAGVTLDAISETVATAQSLAVDAKQALGTKTPAVDAGDAYGGIAVPEVDYGSLVPSDLKNPGITDTATEEELTQGLENYAGAIRAQKLYQEGFKYIAEVGKTKQLYHKAQQSVVRASTEGVKVQQELVRFDRQNVELQIDQSKLAQAGEKLNQEGIKLLGLNMESVQLKQKIEAQERKRDAEIVRLDQQTAKITQRYLTEDIT